MIRIISNEKRYDQIFIRYLGKDYPIKYGSKIYVANAELTNIDLRFFTNGYNLEYACDSTDIPNTMQDVFGKDRVKAWLDLDMDFQSEMKRLFGTPRLAFGIIDKLNNVICPSPNPTGDSYNNLSDKPRVNGVALYGDKSSEQLGLVSTEKYSELLTKVEDTLSTAHATVDFVQTHCVEKSSTKLLSDKDRKLLNDILTALTAGEDNYVIDNETLKSVLELYPTKTSLIDTLSAYTPKSDYIQKLASVDAKIAEHDNILTIHAENMKNYLSLASWDAFQTGYVKTVNGRQISKDNNVVIDAGDISVSAGSDTTIRGKLEDLQSAIGTHTTEINGIKTQNTVLTDQLAGIGNGASTVAKAYRDGNGDIIDTTYVKISTYLDKVDAINSEFTSVRALIANNVASAASTYLTSAALENYYTKTVADDKFLSKADALTTYAKAADTNTALESLSNQVSTRYTKTEADDKFLPKADTEYADVKTYALKFKDLWERMLSSLGTLTEVVSFTADQRREVNRISGIVNRFVWNFDEYPAGYREIGYISNALEGTLRFTSYDTEDEIKNRAMSLGIGYTQFFLNKSKAHLYIGYRNWEDNGFDTGVLNTNRDYTALPKDTVSKVVCNSISNIQSSDTVGTYFYIEESNFIYIVKIVGNADNGKPYLSIVAACENK